jgi:hypothetical protein
MMSTDGDGDGDGDDDDLQYSFHPACRPEVRRNCWSSSARQQQPSM